MFQGFSPETFEFLWGIRFNNQRDWFQAHKTAYNEFLYQPMKALGQELFEPFAQKPGNLLKVSRIYRDARLHHPDPYKESLWICIRQDVEWWAENPCLYFEITPEGASYGFFLWKAKSATMEDYRRRLAGNPREFLELIHSTEDQLGMPITAQSYKRPKPTPVPELEPYFSWKEQISCVRELEPGGILFSPDLVGEVRQHFEKCYPLYEYFNSITMG